MRPYRSLANKFFLGRVRRQDSIRIISFRWRLHWSYLRQRRTHTSHLGDMNSARCRWAKELMHSASLSLTLPGLRWEYRADRASKRPPSYPQERFIPAHWKPQARITSLKHANFANSSHQCVIPISLKRFWESYGCSWIRPSQASNYRRAGNQIYYCTRNIVGSIFMGILEARCVRARLQRYDLSSRITRRSYHERRKSSGSSCRRMGMERS